MEPGHEILRLEGIVKEFPGVRALDKVSLSLRAGQVHALTGENGSGKSTLSRIAAGVMQPDAGRIVFDGTETVLHGPRDALDLGIAMISQELTLATSLTVAENIFLGRLPKTPLGTIDWGSLTREASQVLERLGVHVDPLAIVSDLNVELRQEIEIARALSMQARLLILDEATSSLSEAAADRLMRLVEFERAAGVAVLMITHKMSEIYRAASVSTVLRDGRRVDTVQLENTPEARLVQLMVGREIKDYYGKRPIAIGDPVLDVQDVRTPMGILKPTSLQVHGGEILGIAGLVGSGKTEFGKVLGGAVAASGSVRVAGKPVPLGNPRKSREAGIGYVPDDRKNAALFLTRSVAENFSIYWLRRLSSLGVINTRRERANVSGAIETYRVVTRSPADQVTTLSGGNQQKIVLGRIFVDMPDVLVLSEPTRGIDIGAKSEIYRLLNQAAQSGTAVIVISSELPELLGISDRIAVFHEGGLCAQIPADQADEETIAHLAVTGAAGQEEPTTHQVLN